MNTNIRPIAIYLPQYHPIAENDAWWGKGFTEWTNVAKAKPLFKGHYQPHLPADLGFYDLRLPEAREAQAQLAKNYGIYGFCYYHYWFNGKRLLERPFNEVLASGKPDFPFCLCWANENWTRRWDGQDEDILMEQKYNEQDDLDHISYLCDLFKDKRYICVNSKPIFIVYRTELFPDIKRTSAIWREEARRQGIEDLYLIRVEVNKTDIKPADIGFDAAVEFQPDWLNLPKPQSASWEEFLLYKLRKKNNPYTRNWIFKYADLIDSMLQKNSVFYKRFPAITPSWDNSARRKKGAIIFKDSSPILYEQWLTQIVQKFEPYSKEENFLFINAWNEWAEGNHLEPCQKWNKAYLEATLRALNHA